MIRTPRLRAFRTTGLAGLAVPLAGILAGPFIPPRPLAGPFIPPRPLAGPFIPPRPLSLFAASDPGEDVRPAPKKKGAAEKYAGDCLREGCHNPLAAGKTQHGPFAVNACEVCHLKDRGEHAFKLAAEGEALCALCHEIPPRQSFVHKPIVERGCLDCHDPHSAPERGLLKKETVAHLCLSCHSLPPASHAHEPYCDGACLACHLPHQSEHADLLVSPEPEICLSAAFHNS